MTAIGIIVGSTRPGGVGTDVGRWVHEIASLRGDATFELLDLREFDLPLLDEPVPAAAASGAYSKPHTRRWAEKVASFDGYVFVTPEYNHSVPAALKNAIDYLYPEWHHKAAGFVGYGVDGGVRAMEHLRQVMGQIRIAAVSAYVPLSLYTDFVEFAKFSPAPQRAEAVGTMLADLIAWSDALRAVRSGGPRVED
ncbi:NAD(P)H-dependent oxidoreductase [Phytohabitans flavus]|uniref:FMN reductase n=1 Tax=Phytohabitans flavus TaxID=1076124 RepID=A0A6F8XW55_9ACTN|nr:NAD(P)H-dependent oxidoreductase [Phytohabitans flavus]BCB78043.1 FMN reductase [Phytohabitans flavus]